MSRGQARRSIERLPTVAALGERVRLHPLPDAADIGPVGCTGSAGECMYWFRAEERTDKRWSLFRLFAVCPYDGTAYVSTTPDRQRAQRGAYEPVGPRRHGKSGSQSSGQRSAPPTIMDESWFGPP